MDATCLVVDRCGIGLTTLIYFDISRNMEIAVQQLSSLAHENRLAIFRLLMRRYPQSVPAGELAEAISVPANTASAYLSTLRKARLIEQDRVGTSLRYRVVMESTQGLMDYLMRDCCKGRADLCFIPSMEAPMPDTATKPLTALFICTANSARSIIAEAVLNAEGKGLFKAYSAGTQPTEAPHPRVLKLLSDKGHDISHLSSKMVDVFATEDAPALDFVFTVCDHAANEECPVWPGQPMTAHWGLPDPMKVDGSEAERELALQQTYGLLRNRIRAFTALPLDTLSRMSLQHALDDIGQSDMAESA